MRSQVFTAPARALSGQQHLRVTPACTQRAPGFLTPEAQQLAALRALGGHGNDYNASVTESLKTLRTSPGGRPGGVPGDPRGAAWRARAHQRHQVHDRAPAGRGRRGGGRRDRAGHPHRCPLKSPSGSAIYIGAIPLHCPPVKPPMRPLRGPLHPWVSLVGVTCRGPSETCEGPTLCTPVVEVLPHQ